MRSKEAFAYSRSTGYFCSVAASTVRVKGIIQAPRPVRRLEPAGRDVARHDQLTNAAAAAAKIDALCRAGLT
jgi:hypothetical protein